jgi:CRP-like cAMP-binding protein
VLYGVYPPWHTFIRKVLNEVRQAAEGLLLSQRQLTAEARYLQLLQEDAEIVRAVSVKDMASYLGISPESLSRIRHKLARVR